MIAICQGEVSRVGAVINLRAPEFVAGAYGIGAVHIKNDITGNGTTTITGKFVTFEGLPMAGRVRISHNTNALDAIEIVSVVSKSYILDVNGEFTATVLTGVVVNISAPFISANIYQTDSAGKVKIAKTNSITINTREKTLINLKDII
jgi:hypothetical protein